MSESAQKILYFAVYSESEPEWGGSSCALDINVYESAKDRENDRRLPFTTALFDVSLEEYMRLNSNLSITPIGKPPFVTSVYEAIIAERRKL